MLLLPHTKSLLCHGWNDTCQHTDMNQQFLILQPVEVNEGHISAFVKFATSVAINSSPDIKLWKTKYISESNITYESTKDTESKYTRVGIPMPRCVFKLAYLAFSSKFFIFSAFDKSCIRWNKKLEKLYTKFCWLTNTWLKKLYE